MTDTNDVQKAFERYQRDNPHTPCSFMDFTAGAEWHSQQAQEERPSRTLLRAIRKLGDEADKPEAEHCRDGIHYAIGVLTAVAGEDTPAPVAVPDAECYLCGFKRKEHIGELEACPDLSQDLIEDPAENQRFKPCKSDAQPAPAAVIEGLPEVGQTVEFSKLDEAYWSKGKVIGYYDKWVWIIFNGLPNSWSVDTMRFRVPSSADLESEQSRTASSDLVYVCPIKDIECGPYKRNWCITCPKRAETGTYRKPTPNQEFDNG